MTLTVDFWQLLGMFGTVLTVFVGAIFSAGRMLVGQFERRLDDRFSVQEASRTNAQKHWDEKFLALEKSSQDDSRQWQVLNEKILKLRAELPVNYVMRDDYIRNQTVIEAKIDGLAMRLENGFLKGDRNV